MYGYGPRRGFGLLGLLVGLVFLGIVAAVAYNAGLAAGAGGTAVAPVAHPFFWFGGFHVFGFLFFFVILFLILGAIFRPRGGGWGHHGWYGRYGPGPWGWKQGEGHDVPPPFETGLEAWHRRAHGEAPGEQGERPGEPKS